MTEGNVEKDEWSAITHQHLVLVQRFNRVINTGACQVLHDVGARGFRAVIRLCDTGTADTPGRRDTAAIRESADCRFISGRQTVHVLSETKFHTSVLQTGAAKQTYPSALMLLTLISHQIIRNVEGKKKKKNRSQRAVSISS